MFCKGCEKVHSDRAWKFNKGWYCTKFFRPSNHSEYIPDRIRDDRKEYFNSTIQPFRDGRLSKEYVELHGTEGVHATQEEADNAKYLWSDLDGFNTRHNSK